MLMIPPYTRLASKQKSNLMSKHGKQLVYLCHCSFNACNPVGVSIGALSFFLAFKAQVGKASVLPVFLCLATMTVRS